MPSVPYVYDGNGTTQWPHHHCSDHCHHAIILLFVVSWTNRGQTAKKINHLSLRYHISPASYIDQAHISAAIDHLNGHDTHFLCFKLIRDKKKGYWVNAHCLAVHPLHPKMTRDKSQWVWVVAHGFVANLLCFKPIREKC